MTDSPATEFGTGDGAGTERAGASSAPAPSLGAQLRQAREAQSHSIADVVQVIRFSAHQIEALERDDYASLPGATSVRGLVRNYAKFLKLDPGPLLDLLDPAVPVPAADVRPPTNMGEAEKASLGKQTTSPVLVAGMSIVVLALAGYWYMDDRAESVSARKPIVPDVAVQRSSQAAAEMPVVPPTAAVIATAAVASDEPQAPAPANGLRLEFDDRSWVEIRDATQKVILVGEFSAGARQNVEGKPPYQVWIGKASGVRVFLGDRNIDLKPHTREQVARLSLE